MGRRSDSCKEDRLGEACGALEREGGVVAGANAAIREARIALTYAGAARDIAETGSAAAGTEADEVSERHK